MDNISAPDRARWRARVPRRLAVLRGMLAIWTARKRLRWDLERKLRDDPHLIDDIGLTARQAEAEIAKPFWKA